MTSNTSTAAHWTEHDWNMFSIWIKELLKTNAIKVTFTKKDGTERVMNCTLNPEKLPVSVVTESKEPKKKNDNVMPVYDIDAGAWRSFTIKSVKTVEFVI